MAKIDLEKVLIALLDSPFNKQFDDKIKNALKEQDLEYKDGEIVEIQKLKFKVGDWVVWQNKCYKVNYNGCGYELIDQNGLRTSLEYGTVDKSAHLWTIEDAKDGDVLVDVYGNIGIFDKCYDFDWMSYCSLGNKGGFQYFTVEHENEKTYPATKEERELLFQKMKEAGYEWDADKKELKGIDNRFDYEHANMQQNDFAPKATTANRQLYNRAILAILSNYVEKYPDTRFWQMLCNLDIKPDFDQESRETYRNLNETIKRDSL